MPDVFQSFTSSCNANVGVGNPTVALSVGAGIWRVVRVTIVIPAGHAGLTGIQLWYGGGPAIPYDSGWFSGDDRIVILDLSDDFPPGVPWSVAMINADGITHNWETDWEMNYISANAQSVSAPPVTAGDIYAATAAQ